ncbi:NYN domain-containing protein [Candidatus Latescibacterota bacterium]
MDRTVFLIDGFNLYHSLIDAEKISKSKGTKWLDIKSLCISYLSQVGNDAQIEDIYYFSAIACHYKRREPSKIKRHKDYISCLEDSGIKIVLGRFKLRPIKCKRCNNRIKNYEEKETDVAIASKLLELSFMNKCDSLVIMSGDTDLIPAIRTVKQHVKNKRIIIAFPYGRKNDDLIRIVHHHFKISLNMIQKNQLPNPYIMQNGTHITKPVTW